MAKQLSFTFHLFHGTHEEMALNWWASRITEAEVSTGNLKALENPIAYSAVVKERFAWDLGLVEAVTEEWQKASREGTLNEPVWKHVPIRKFPKSNVIILGAAS